MKAALVVKVLAPYSVPRYRAWARLGASEVRVLALGRFDPIREWDLSLDGLGFSYAEAMPGAQVDSVPAGALRRAVTRWLQREEPDVLVVAGYADAGSRAALAWARTRGRVVVMNSHSTWLDRPRSWLREWAKARLVRRCHAGFVPGERAAAYLTRLGLKPWRIWRRSNVVDNDWFAGQSERWKQHEADLRVTLGLPRQFFLYVGRFVREKNVDRLLEAYRTYRALTASEPWGLVMVGNGPETRWLEEHVRTADLGDVVIAGFRQIDELPAFYALAGCLILPSVSEPWGLVVNEAMASGLPVLVSERCGCVPELVQPGLNGYAFNPYSIDDVARTMVRMTSGDVDLKDMGEESRRIIAAYTPDTWAKSLADCVAGVPPRAGGPANEQG